MSYVLEGLIPMQFVDNHSESAVQHKVQMPGGYLVNSYDYVVQAYGMRYEQRWHDVGCLFAFAVGACRLPSSAPLAHGTHIQRLIAGFQVLHMLALRNKVFLNR